MEAVAISPGASLGDRYTLRRRLGAGGMASVWLADDDVLGRAVAVKVMADTLAFDPHYRTRFEREARAAASVSHRNIVPVYDYGLHDDRPFLVMEYVTGGSLADVLAGRRRVLPDAAEIAVELLGALGCVHAAGLVHRDVKPANILLDGAGHARLTDFGIAQPEDAASLTQTGMIVGSIRYLAPEVTAGARATAAADLFAVGVVLRELADRAPAPGLSLLIDALTAQQPDDRPSSAEAAVGLLATRPAEAGEPDEPTAPTRVAPAVGPASGAVPRSPRTARHPARPGGPAAPDLHARRPALALRVAPRALAAAAVVVLVLVVIAVLIATQGGGSPSGATAAPTAGRPAAAGAPLSSQLSTLRGIVASAAKP
ncbi:MAG TPA: protein kinase [Solirubrobacteraceae bacterium]